MQGTTSKYSLKKFDREFADIFSIQSEIAKQVARNLETVLSPNEQKQIEKEPTQNIEAYNLYLMGRFLWNRRTGEGIKKSIEYFNKAIELDPNYALAYTGLADVYIMLPAFGLYTPKNEGHEKAYFYALKAVELDKNLAEAHTSLGFVLMYVKWKWEEAEKELKLSLELNPNYAFAHQLYAQFLDITGNYVMARQEINIALKLDPLAPIIHSISASFYYNEGKFDASLNEYQEALLLEKNYRQAHWQRFVIFYRLGDEERALNELKQRCMLDTLNLKYVNIIDQVYTKSGITGIIDIACEILPEDAARLYAISGHKKEALTCIENYLEDSPGDGLVRLINKIDYKSLRSEPRFKAVVDKLGLTEYYLKRVKDPGYITVQ
jgi:tetratricopeptide (TPR) repeat protein